MHAGSEEALSAGNIFNWLNCSA